MKGTVFQLKAGSHPWFIISEELVGWVLAANLSDAEKHPKSTCHIEKGEHRAVIKNSAVFYKGALIMRLTDIKKELAGYANIYSEPCSPELMQRIVAGALTQDSGLPRKFRKYLE